MSKSLRFQQNQTMLEIFPRMYFHQKCHPTNSAHSFLTTKSPWSQVAFSLVLSVGEQD